MKYTRLLALLALLLPTFAAAPTSRPAGERRGGPPPGEVAERFRENIQKLDLSDEQKAKVRGVLEEMKAKGDEIRELARNGATDSRDKARALIDETREKLSAILDKDQRERLRELMRGPSPRRRGGEDEPRMTSTAPAAEMMSGDSMTMEGSSKSTGSRAARGGPAVAELPSPDAGPKIGDAAPDFALHKLDGSLVDLASLKGRVVVLVFGSYSAPTFRNRATAIDKLRSDYNTRAQVFVVYAREAYPNGEWEVDRNKDQGISVDQTRSIEARCAAAQQAREQLKLTTPILLDSIGNDTATSYAAGPNSACVIGRDGRIVARQQWFEPIALRRALDQATAAKNPTTKPAE